MMLKFSVCAVGMLGLLFIEMGKILEGARFGGEGQSFIFGHYV